MMLPKPTECQGCPLYGDGQGFVPDRIVPKARLVILGQNPGKDEEEGQRVFGHENRHALYEACTPQPFIGKTGYDLERKYLPLTGFARDEVSMCNVLKCRWQRGGKRTNDLPTGRLLDEAVAHCTRAHLHIPEDAECVVCVGGLAAKALGCAGTITEWRGNTWEYVVADRS